jgi:hypothetical protein
MRCLGGEFTDMTTMRYPIILFTETKNVRMDFEGVFTGIWIAFLIAFGGETE